MTAGGKMRKSIIISLPVYRLTGVNRRKCTSGHLWVYGPLIMTDEVMLAVQQGVQQGIDDKS